MWLGDMIIRYKVIELKGSKDLTWYNGQSRIEASKKFNKVKDRDTPVLFTKEKELEVNEATHKVRRGMDNFINGITK